jgi:hypothetical protein
VAPAQLLDNHVSIKKDFTDVHWVITTDLVIRHPFILAGILILEEALTNLILQGSEIFLYTLIFLLHLVIMLSLLHRP